MPHAPTPKAVLDAYLDMALSIAAAFRRANVIALLTVLGVLVTFSALVYRLLEGWGFLDSVYFCVVTMATVGYGDFAPHTALGKIFTMFYLLIGIGMFVLAVTAIADAIYQEFRARAAAREH